MSIWGCGNLQQALSCLKDWRHIRLDGEMLAGTMSRDELQELTMP